jgi:transposase-like protein
MGQSQDSKRWTAARARQVLAEAKESGESLSAFAERHGIDPQRLYSWRRKLEASTASSETFVPVRVASEAKTPASCDIELVLKTGSIVRVGPDFDIRALRRLIEALEEGAR